MNSACILSNFVTNNSKPCMYISATRSSAIWFFFHKRKKPSNEPSKTIRNIPYSVQGSQLLLNLLFLSPLCPLSVCQENCFQSILGQGWLRCQMQNLKSLKRKKMREKKRANFEFQIYRSNPERYFVGWKQQNCIYTLFNREPLNSSN